LRGIRSPPHRHGAADPPGDDDRERQGDRLKIDGFAVDERREAQGDEGLQQLHLGDARDPGKLEAEVPGKERPERMNWELRMSL